jgi:hypothetical protein
MSIIDKIKNKFSDNNSLQIDKTLLYSYLVLGRLKYQLDFDIYLLTESQDHYSSIHPSFIMEYRNKKYLFPIEVTYYELLNEYANKYKLPAHVLCKLNEFVVPNREIFLLYYGEKLDRKETINQIIR